MTWRVKILTLFPEMFPGPLGYSLSGKALQKGIWSLEAISIRQFATDPHGTVDDTPYGGGAGMVMRPEIVAHALEYARGSFNASPILYFSPVGEKLSQERAREYIGLPELILLCGRYEGLDERVIQAYNVQKVSLGDFILSGGEIAALALIDMCVRLLPGVIGKAESLKEESFSCGLLEYPHYTRPAEWKGLKVPEVLLSGHHARIRQWRKEQAERLTQEHRPDLWQQYIENYLNSE